MKILPFLAILLISLTTYAQKLSPIEYYCSSLVFSDKDGAIDKSSEKKIEAIITVNPELEIVKINTSGSPLVIEKIIHSKFEGNQMWLGIENAEYCFIVFDQDTKSISVIPCKNDVGKKAIVYMYERVFAK